jgi:hypothetical protein
MMGIVVIEEGSRKSRLKAKNQKKRESLKKKEKWKT